MVGACTEYVAMQVETKTFALAIIVGAGMEYVAVQTETDSSIAVCIVRGTPRTPNLVDMRVPLYTIINESPFDGADDNVSIVN